LLNIINVNNATIFRTPSYTYTGTVSSNAGTNNLSTTSGDLVIDCLSV